MENQLVNSAHDCSEGGLAVALAESSIIGKLGFSGSIDVGKHWAPALFGEQTSRIIVSVSENKIEQFEAMCRENQTPFVKLGTVINDEFSIKGIIDGSLDGISRPWATVLNKALGE